MIDLVLSGHKKAVGKIAARPDEALPTRLSPFKASDLDGRTLDAAELSGKVTIVEFWATWCVPCHSTLAWFGELKRRYGEQLNIVAAAVESEDKEIRKYAAGLGSSIRIVPAAPEFVTLFGDISSVPTMYIFDRQGKAVKVFYGAPKDISLKVRTPLHWVILEAPANRARQPHHIFNSQPRHNQFFGCIKK